MHVPAAAGTCIIELILKLFPANERPNIVINLIHFQNLKRTA